MYVESIIFILSHFVDHKNYYIVSFKIYIYNNSHEHDNSIFQFVSFHMPLHISLQMKNDSE